jgi:hypothetical protein
MISLRNPSPDCISIYVDNVANCTQIIEIIDSSGGYHWAFSHMKDEKVMNQTTTQSIASESSIPEITALERAQQVL